MFRVEMVEARGGITLAIEGRFVGPYAEETKQLIVRRKSLQELTVDISEVTYVDSVGELALTWMRQIGAKFVAEDSYSLDVCERLHLPTIGTNYRGGFRASESGSRVYGERRESVGDSVGVRGL